MSDLRARPLSEGLNPLAENGIELRWPSEDTASASAGTYTSRRSASGIDLNLFQNVDTTSSSKKLRGFYTKQNALIAMMKAHAKTHRYGTSNSGEDAELGRGESKDGDDDGDAGDDDGHIEVPDSNALVQSAILLSFGCNVLLLVLKGWMALVTGSMSILASAADSLLDLLSGLVLLLTERATHNVDHYKYPEGRARLEPIGVVIFATVNLLLSLEKTRAL
jgi:hypothetical protein